jgi:hypothetical protein
MATLVSSKYSLRTLHEEIGLLDRKIAHLHKYETFRSDADRDAAAAKIEHKRDLLVRQARLMVEEGIEFEASDLPQSLREADDAEIAPELAAAPAPEAPAGASKRKAVKPESPFSGTVLDPTEALREYKEKKGKRSAPPVQPAHASEAAAAS